MKRRIKDICALAVAIGVLVLGSGTSLYAVGKSATYHKDSIFLETTNMNQNFNIDKTGIGLQFNFDSNFDKNSAPGPENRLMAYIIECERSQDICSQSYDIADTISRLASVNDNAVKKTLKNNVENFRLNNMQTEENQANM